MKKILAFVMALLMVFSLVACKDAGNENNATDGSSASSTNKAGGSENVSTEGGSEVELDTKNPIKIGLLGLTSGSGAYLGLVAIAAVQDQIDQVNATGGLLGRKVELVWYDISKDYTEAVHGTNKLINEDKVDAIIGPSGSGYAIALGDIVNEAEVPLLTQGGNKAVSLNEDGSLKPYVFKVAPSTALEAKTCANYAYNELGARKVATLTEATFIYSVESTESFIAEFERLGGEIVTQENYMENEKEFRAQITSIGQKEPEYIYLPGGSYNEVCNFAIQLSDMGYSDNIKIIGNDGWYSYDAIEIAGNELEGSYIISGLDMYSDDLRPLTEAFEKDHGDLNMSLHQTALYSVNAFEFLKWAIPEAGTTDGPAIKAALEACTGVDMITGGSWYFDENHDAIGPSFSVISVKDGDAVTIGSYKMP